MTAAGIERLQRRRTAARGWVTRTANVLADLLDQAEKSGAQLGVTIQSAKRECEARLQSLDEVQALLECELEDEAYLEAAWTFREGVRQVLLRSTS